MHSENHSKTNKTVDDSQNSPVANKRRKIGSPSRNVKKTDSNPVKKQMNNMMTLLEQNMAGPCKDLIDSHIKHRHTGTNPPDCMELSNDVLLKHVYYKCTNQK